MRRFLLVLMTLGLLAWAPVGAMAQGYVLALGVQGKVQGEKNLPHFGDSFALSDQELWDIHGLGDQVLDPTENSPWLGGLRDGLVGALAGATLYCIDCALMGGGNALSYSIATLGGGLVAGGWTAAMIWVRLEKGYDR